MKQQVVVGAGSPAGEEQRRPWTGKVFAMSPDERWVAVAAPEHTVQIWQVETERLWSTYYGHQRGVYHRTTESIKDLDWVDNERVVSESEDRSIHCWHARTGNHLRTLVEAGRPGKPRVASVQDAVRLLLGKLEPA